MRVHPHGEMVRAAREKVGLTQQEVADHFKLSLEDYASLEESKYTMDYRKYIPIMTYLWGYESNMLNET